MKLSIFQNFGSVRVGFGAPKRCRGSVLGAFRGYQTPVGCPGNVFREFWKNRKFRVFAWFFMFCDLWDFDHPFDFGSVRAGFGAPKWCRGSVLSAFRGYQTPGGCPGNVFREFWKNRKFRFFSWFFIFCGLPDFGRSGSPWIRIGFGPVWGRPVGIPRLYLGRQMEFGDKLSIWIHLRVACDRSVTFAGTSEHFTVSIYSYI